LLRLLDDGGEPNADPAAPSPSLRHLDELARSVRSTGLDVEFDVVEPLPGLSPIADLTAYRVIQEALTNTMRHAPGATARVVVTTSGDDLLIHVTDSGRLNRSTTSPGSGRGLIGMHERLTLVGGGLEMSEASAQGFEVRARLPIEGGRTEPAALGHASGVPS
jgi:signal transduction histidine kinase